MESTTATQHKHPTSVRVVEAIADARETDAVDLRPPLYDVIDPNALDQLCRDGGPVSIEFEYQGHAVTVSSDGTVSVDGQVY